MHGQGSREAGRRGTRRQPAKLLPKHLLDKGQQVSLDQKRMEEEGTCLRKTRLWQKSQEVRRSLSPEVTQPDVWEVSGGGVRRDVLASDGRSHTANPPPRTTTVVLCKGCPACCVPSRPRWGVQALCSKALLLGSGSQCFLQGQELGFVSVFVNPASGNESAAGENDGFCWADALLLSSISRPPEMVHPLAQGY